MSKPIASVANMPTLALSIGPPVAKSVSDLAARRPGARNRPSAGLSASRPRARIAPARTTPADDGKRQSLCQRVEVGFSEGVVQPRGQPAKLPRRIVALPVVRLRGSLPGLRTLDQRDDLRRGPSGVSHQIPDAPALEV